MNITDLRDIVVYEYADVVDTVFEESANELRIILIDGSFIDVWFSPVTPSKYSYHWERKKIDGTIYRHDNVPHLKWKHIETFPKHFHYETEQNVTESYINDLPEEAIREVLDFVRTKI